MEIEKKSQQELVEKYKDEVMRFARYIPWFQKQSADNVATMYKGEGTSVDFSFPVYDSTLLSFIKEAQKSMFMDYNYQYVYSRYRIRSHEDEWKVIDSVTIMNMEVLCGILSKYVLGGMTKASLWKEAVQYEIFLRVLEKAKEVIEYWDKPMNQ